MDIRILEVQKNEFLKISYINIYSLFNNRYESLSIRYRDNWIAYNTRV